MAAHNGLAEAVIKLVHRRPGLTMQQIAHELARRSPNIKQALYRMRKAGRVYCAGVAQCWHYYATAEAAAAHDARLRAEAEERRRLSEQTQVRQANLRRKAQRQAAGCPSNNNRAASAVRVSLAPGAVLSPNVRVTIAPPPRDRFAPEPGWVRVISADADARRHVKTQ